MHQRQLPFSRQHFQIYGQDTDRLTGKLNIIFQRTAASLFTGKRLIMMFAWTISKSTDQVQFFC